jgi:8-amino-7-oxononanoate synthase
MSCYAMWNQLLDHGVYVNMAIPPGTPGGLCLLRCSVSAAHTTYDIDEIIALFGAVVSKGSRRVVNG